MSLIQELKFEMWISFASIFYLFLTKCSWIISMLYITKLFQTMEIFDSLKKYSGGNLLKILVLNSIVITSILKLYTSRLIFWRLISLYFWYLIKHFLTFFNCLGYFYNKVVSVKWILHIFHKGLQIFALFLRINKEP